MVRPRLNQGTPALLPRGAAGLVATAVAVACVLTSCSLGPVAPGPAVLTQQDPAAVEPSVGPGGASRRQESHAAGELLVWSRFDDFSTHTARLVAADGTGAHAVPITHPPAGAIDVHPRVSPDGQSVLFERDLPGRSTVMIVPSRGGIEREVELGCVVPCVAAREPAWTNDGDGLVYTRVVDRRGASARSTSASRTAVLWMSSLTGAHQARLTAAGAERQFAEGGATFAPRGYLVSVRTQADGRTALFRLAASGGNARQLTPWSIGVDSPRVSPAASGATADLIVFETSGASRADAAADESILATVPASCDSVAECSARLRFLTRPSRSPMQFFNPTWSPDGTRIAFAAATWHGGRASADIWTMHADGSHQHLASRDWRFEVRPDWGIRAG